ncbi:kinase-like domain-containing protein [Rhizophagus irregularis DAOM 181602=DAOM 197198]|uniref:Kinase-like domain-containing protein n=1 Tax=Rhizophagus irregularis (strain DAOM 181602 / DAOM 197198 / MUCL 43194) TaxID=747089 RepID=A0A2P4P3N6_RHIID|nr:kinase-like domain-containing protein [Rhizophagus irregularis DAOM 181602=DAOM 197198]POG59985.1 kinase-like domain-containing protein [Rhizophagus irregularis DAOM 181602=DAOM 197198]|eukprot:XP_025166851.1 kinase-like domain-containing protein [Rhizophagus irregularis DAOM 181602=DAOM 197198]
MTSLCEWIDMKIRDDDINYFDYDEFSNFEKVGEGAFGIVNKADWKSCGIKIALKIIEYNSVNQDNMNRFLKELRNLRKVNFHPNINRFLGITKEPITNNYIMVLQYANRGNLREYLKNNFKSLNWDDKIRMASEITCGLKCLHSRKIIHRDLHAKNILVDNNNLMIADLGLSKHLTGEITSNSIAWGMLEYIEPQCYVVDNYVRDKRSDIYSLGILLWEITSGYPPFPSISRATLCYRIANGYRESPMNDTPLEYVELYQKCWDNDPDLRPNAEEVYDTLKRFSKDNSTVDIKINIYSDETNSNSSNILNNENNLQSRSYLTIDDNINELNLAQFTSQISTPSMISSSISEYEKGLRDDLEEIIQNYLKRNKIGWIKTFDFNKVLERYESRSKEIFNYLINNPTLQYYELMLGVFYNRGFGVNKSINIAFEWYMRSSQQNDFNGYYEVGFYYYLGYTVEKNYNERSLEFCQHAVNNGLNIALHFLASCYHQFNYNAQNNSIIAFELFKKSAENGFIPSQYELAECYKNGEGTQKNKIEALKWYKSYQENDGEINVSYPIKDIENELFIRSIP